ncbi:ABC transporter permease subunit [Staphylococcus kloosii]|jgi:His/Glu/Gln/Arg/opine family amino acid ABC transporter permease subunit|uniref:ABC transporter permease n=1 Tax=Staphylococcus kloosii TaxID=29384 RepID=A0A921GZR7_9STAP|nr:ABC transporter permease subunit [Staphylococcus kloosii]AVQ35821.1 glutamate ABC transporter permease [Staphylococcus kloosii]MBF7021711.1 ABC transporter permease subunit [Staphylococcus kloosii]MBF7029779.1 ABC transporter permease subunit [Staphylococcus kloosii]MCD8879018.1 ABC transporter permease subunit [Staphylococcus kloosii]PNZ03198.1 glutamate ABC transporter permease [Staphylococcus kloosii]
MKVFGKIMLATIIILSSISLYIKPTTHAAEDKQWEKIKKRGELRVGLSADYAPYEFEHNVNGKTKYAGIDIELAKKIAKDNNLKLKIVNMQFDSLLGAIKTGKIDLIISGMTPTPEREKEVDFSNPYMTVTQKMIIKKANEDKLKTLDDFTNKRIGVQKQTQQETIANEEINNAQVQSLTRVPEVIMSLKSGKVDGMVIEGPVAEAYLKQNPDLKFANGVKFKEGEKQTAIAVPKHSPTLMKQLNSTIKEVKDKNLVDKYKDKAAEAMKKDDGNFFTKYGSFFLKGIGNTILVSIVGVVLGALFGAIIALFKLSKFKPLRWLASAYIEFLRGTPLLVQVFLVYFGSTAVLGLDISALICGMIALVINCSAYIAEIIRAGINAVDKGQMEAARSLGLSYGQTMKSVILPQAIKNILPALGNEFVTVIKESSIISVIGVSEIMFNAQVVQGASFDPFTPLLVAAILYFVLTFTLSRVMYFFEGRLKVSD